MIKKQNGAITLYVTIACLFIIVIGIGAYVITSTIPPIKNTYNVRTPVTKTLKSGATFKTIAIITGTAKIKRIAAVVKMRP